MIADEKRIDKTRNGDSRLDELYDLACWLTRDEGEAERLILSTLRQDVRSAEGCLEEERNLLHLLVRGYLRQNASVLSSRSNPIRRRGLRSQGSLQRASWIEDGIYRLDPQERSCLILHERLGLSAGEIAAIVGLDSASVHRRLFSGRELLRAALSREAPNEIQYQQLPPEKESVMKTAEVGEVSSAVFPLLLIVVLLLISPLLYDLIQSLQHLIGR